MDSVEVQEKENKVVVLSSRPPEKREIRKFHVVVMQWRQRNL